MLMVCVELMIGGKNVQFHIIFSSSKVSVSIQPGLTPPPPDSLDNGIVKPKNRPFKATPEYLPTVKYCLKPLQPVLKSETLTVRAFIHAY